MYTLKHYDLQLVENTSIIVVLYRDPKLYPFCSFAGGICEAGQDQRGEQRGGEI